MTTSFISSFTKDSKLATSLVILIAALVGIVSIIITKSFNNPVEKIAADVIDEELGLPEGAIQIKDK